VLKLIDPVVSLDKKVSMGNLCISIVKCGHPMAPTIEWRIIVEAKKLKDGSSEYYVPPSGRYAYKDGDVKLHKEIQSVLEPEDWVDISRITDKVNQAIDIKLNI